MPSTRETFHPEAVAREKAGRASATESERVRWHNQLATLEGRKTVFDLLKDAGCFLPTLEHSTATVMTGLVAKHALGQRIFLRLLTREHRAQFVQMLDENYDDGNAANTN